MTEYKRLKGTEDIFGETALQFEWVESQAREVFQAFGFEEMRTPYLEPKKLFTRALGETTDVVQKEMYEFLDKSDESVALRPEGTAGVVRAYLENNFDKNQTLAKFFYVGPMFRRERPQKGRLRQFHQIGVELIGEPSPLADAEVIHSLVTYLDRLGIQNYKLKLNNIGTIADRQRVKEEIQRYAKPHLDQLCEDCKKRIQTNPFRLLDCKNETCRKLMSSFPALEHFFPPESKIHYTNVCEALDSIAIKYEVAPHMVRGLDYYTNTVFELTHSSLGSQDALAAGGRYDTLVEAFGGPSVGAVGFALGIERLLLCLGPQPLPKKMKVSFFIVTLGEQAQKEGFRLLSTLRQKKLTAHMNFSAKSLKAQMRAADKFKSSYVVLLGEDEMKKKSATLKDMAKGSQEEISLATLVETLEKKTSC